MRREISGLTVTFSPPITIRRKEISSAIIVRVIDEPGKKAARAFVNGYKTVVLWEGDDYTNAGQWTDTDVINKVSQIMIADSQS